MNAHPSVRLHCSCAFELNFVSQTPALTLLLSKYPKTSGSLFLVYNDVSTRSDILARQSPFFFGLISLQRNHGKTLNQWISESSVQGAQYKVADQNTDSNEPVYVVPMFFGGNGVLCLVRYIIYIHVFRGL